MDSRIEDRTLGVLYMIIGIAVLWHNAHDGYSHAGTNSTPNTLREREPRHAEPSPEKLPPAVLPDSQFAE